ncbi:hypothetical protein [Streptomyces aureocirculatus]|uniref:hypothetical protein n=1 Tax=Streptomyces aureocirculatus TaxID=67275 RepID=UPI0004C719CF|nr:hypothetical protein [Streptomyces aureocirculatus]
MIALVNEDAGTVAALLAGAIAGSAVTLAALKWCVDLASKPGPPREDGEAVTWPPAHPAPCLPVRPARTQEPGADQETQPLTVARVPHARHRRPAPTTAPRAGRTLQAGDHQ